MSHTPGPWFVEEQGKTDGRRDYIIRDVKSHTPNIAAVYLRRDENKANAALISAAPELLAALERMHDFVSDAVEGGRVHEDDRQAFIVVCEKSNAAIAKARGKDGN